MACDKCKTPFRVKITAKEGEPNAWTADVGWALVLFSHYNPVWIFGDSDRLGLDAVGGGGGI